MRWSNSSSFSAPSARSRSSARAIRSCSSSAGSPSRSSAGRGSRRNGRGDEHHARDGEERAEREPHQLFAGAYFDGHFVTSVFALGDEGAVLVAAVDDDLAAELELVGHAAAVDDRHAGVALPSRRRGSAGRRFAYPAPCTGPTTRP